MLTRARARSALHGPAHAPPLAELEAAFGLFAAARPEAHAPAPGARGEVRCACAQCAAWARYTRGATNGGYPLYEVHTAEHVRLLAALLLALRAALLPLLPARALRVLELGAGSGRLAHLLRAQLARAAAARGEPESGVLLIASDASPLPCCPALPAAAAFPVLRARCEAALAACAPDVALVCWMPLGQDWCAAVRACPSVHACVLVGEAGRGICGDAERTWGGGGAGAPLPARVGGWAVAELAALARRQLCRLDEPWCNVRHSTTVLSARDERVARALAAAFGPSARVPPEGWADDEACDGGVVGGSSLLRDTAAEGCHRDSDETDSSASDDDEACSDTDGAAR